MASMPSQQLNAHKTSCLARRPVPLRQLIVNNRFRSNLDGCKPNSTTPTNRSTMPRHISRRYLWIKPLDLPPNQVEAARAIFEILQTIPHMSKRTPALRLLGNDIHCRQYELEYPKYRLWELASHYFLSRLTRNSVRRLRDDLINTVSQLYDAHVAYVLDLATFSVLKRLGTRQRRATFVPFFDAFDFDKHPNNPTISWEDLKNKQLAIIKTHFVVLEMVAEMPPFALLSQSPPVRADIHPDIMVKVVKQSCSHDEQRIWAIRSMTSYSPKLGQFVIEIAQRRARTILPGRNPDNMQTNNSIRHNCSTINYVLGLLDQYMQDRQVEHSDLADRAALLVVHGVLVVQLHAKHIAVLHSQGILDINSDGTPDAYTSYDGFQAVAKARSLAKEAIRRLDANHQLDPEISYFLRADA